MFSMKLGIIGAGHIAIKMASTLAGKPQGCECYAVASRSLDKAGAFAAEHGIQKAYGSYRELVEDPEVDLVYIATPHSFHYEHTRMALESGKPCLVEKAFTMNAREAEGLVNISESRGVFLTEAIWTRYLPMSHKVAELLSSGVIGEPKLLRASLCYPVSYKERIQRPELGGGALLDLGVYVLNFARMYFGTDIVKTATSCVTGPTGVDLQESISLTYGDGRMANLQASALCINDRQGIISGTEGSIIVDNVNCPSRIDVYRGYDLVQTIGLPSDFITGFEYQVFECQRCLSEGLVESPMMPHGETVAVMRQMDGLRKTWGL
ncbi:MAG: Gfo/Idh/MocA family protein [Candidatus Cryptobacteroides sp.]